MRLLPGLLGLLLLAASAPALPSGDEEARALAAVAEARALAARVDGFAEGSASESFARLVALAGVVPVEAPPVVVAAPLDAPPALRPALGAALTGIATAGAILEAAPAAGWTGPGLRAGVAAPKRLPYVAAAELALLRGIETAATLAPSSVETRPGRCATGAVAYEDALCTIVVGGPGPNVYTRTHVLSLDFGGADMYRNNAGGSFQWMPVAAALDLGADDDVYDTAVPPEYRRLGYGVQGGTFAGAAALVDEGGNDVYRAAGGAQQNEELAAQGAGVAGAAVLWDRGAGDDVYASRNFAHGVGIDGFGLLLDEGGADVFHVAYTWTSEGTQGAGCWGGAGALVSRGEGNDEYNSTTDDAQGFGCLGAVGLLWDEAGDDRYVLRAGYGDHPAKDFGHVDPELLSGWGQGYGELAAIGILRDLAGDDLYLAENTNGMEFEGFMVQGAGQAGAGLLLDDAGHDRYVARTGAQGAAWAGGGTGLLLDAGGDDRYHAELVCQGAGRGGSAILVDERGRDSYRCVEACQGAGRGLFWDRGPEADHYDCPEPPRFLTRGNARTWIGQEFGVGRDEA